MKTVCGAATFLLAAGLCHQSARAQDDTIILDNMTQYYAAVEFAHTVHVEALGDESCATCHHHTVGTPLVDENCKRCHATSNEADTAACRDCHSDKRFSAEYLEELASNIHMYHVDKPGLKGAFHQRCLGCHVEMGIPADCQVCHARIDEGDKLFYAGKYAPVPEKTSSGH
ncbi:MAG: cytochrome c3 family protein [Thermodesulfobacteriota bacterium]